MLVKKWWNAQPRWLTRTLLIFVGTLFGVVASTNIILWLGVVPRLLNADSAALGYRFAWSPWPTYVHVRGLTITGQDDNIQFAVGVDEGWLTLDLFDTFRDKTITITRVRGSGVSVRVLQRIQPWLVTEKKVNALPDIPGRTKPPITFASVPNRPATRDNYDDISIDISDIDVQAKEVWVDQYRLQGIMHVMGSFLLRPGLELRIGPVAEVNLREAQLTIAKRPVLRSLEGRVSCLTPAFNPTQPDGFEILHFFNATFSVRGKVVNAEAAAYFIESAEPNISGGAGKLQMDVAFERGTLQPGSTAALEMQDLQLQMAQTAVRASLALRADVNEQRLGSLVASTTGLTVVASQAPGSLRGGDFKLELATTEPVNLGGPAPQASYSLALSRLAGELSVINPYIPSDSPIALDDGDLSVEGEVSGDFGKPNLQANVLAESAVKAHLDEQRLTARLKARAHVQQSDSGYSFADSRVAISDLMSAQGKDVLYGWWGQVEIGSGGWVSKENQHLAFGFHGLLRDVEPLFVFGGTDLDIPDWVQAVLPLPETSFRGHLAAEAGALRLSDFRATSGIITARAKVKVPPQTEPTGAVQLASGPLSYGLAFAPGTSDTQVMATDAWFESQP